MAKKISELASASTPLSGSELLEIVQGGVSKSVSAADLAGSGGSGSSREVISSNRTYYVRTDGSDSNDGRSNTSGGAFLTIQKAVDVICGTLDINAGITVTISVQDGTYTTPVVLYKYSGPGKVSIVGNVTTPANVVISTTSANAVSLAVPAYYEISGIKLQTTTSGSGLFVVYGGIIAFSAMNFGACALAHMLATMGGKITATGNYAISGGAGGHILATTAGAVDINSRTVTLTGTPNFSSAFIWMSEGMGMSNAYSVTFSGGASGKRYIVNNNSVCFVNGAGSTYIPGTVAGTTAAGGQYA